MTAQSPTRLGRLTHGRRWVVSVCTAVVLVVGGDALNDAFAAPSSAAAVGRDSSTGQDGTSGGGASATEVVQVLSTCARAVNTERPPNSALAICRGVATAPWETNHTRTDAHILLGRALGRLGRFAEALDAAYAAKQLNADDSDVHLFEAWVLLKLRRLDEARRAAQTVVSRKWWKLVLAPLRAG